jgi:hypothetical protein
MPDFDDGLILNVSLRAREVIEQVEPIIHQFVPVEYFRPNGKPLGSRYFLFVCNRVDGVHRASPGMVLRSGRLWCPTSDLPAAERPPGYSPDVKPELVFDEARIEDHHLWVDKHLLSGTYLSDTLADAITRTGLTGVRLVSVQTR